MSQEEVVACDQCKQVPDNYLSLNCGHCFCLICMAQSFLKGGRIFKLEGTDNIHYICTVCEKDTPLDEGSVSVVESICHQLIQTSLEKVREDQNNNNKEDKPLEQSQIIAQPKCEIHTKEDATLFCFTCENKCFCIKCLLRHDILNIYLIQFNYFKQNIIILIQIINKITIIKLMKFRMLIAVQKD